MSKKMIICTIMAMALILTGTGYAYWTDTLNVTTKATTGDLEVVFVDVGYYAQYNEDQLNPNGNPGWTIIDGVGVNGYVDSTFFRRGNSDFNKYAADGTVNKYYELADKYNSIDFEVLRGESKDIGTKLGTDKVHEYGAGVLGTDEINISINNMYPGYAQTFRSDIINIGSIAARLSNIKFDLQGLDGVTSTSETNDMLGVAILIEREFEPNDADHLPVFELCKALNLSSDAYFTVGGVEFIRMSYLANVDQKVISEYAELLSLSSRNCMDLFVGIAMDPDAAGIYTTGSAAEMNTNNDDADTQNTGVSLNVKLLWDQFNEGVNVESENILVNQNR